MALNRGGILTFECRTCPGALGRLHHELQAGDDLRREMLHELSIFMDEGLAFRTIGQHEFNLGLRLHVSGETSTPGPGPPRILSVVR